MACGKVKTNEVNLEFSTAGFGLVCHMLAYLILSEYGGNYQA